MCTKPKQTMLCKEITRNKEKKTTTKTSDRRQASRAPGPSPAANRPDPLPGRAFAPALYYTNIYYTTLYYTILYYTILYYTILYFLGGGTQQTLGRLLPFLAPARRPGRGPDWRGLAKRI